MEHQTNWNVITGGPGIGKTTLIEMLAGLGYTTTVENARLYIEEELAKGISINDIRSDFKKLQTSILKKQIHTESELNKDQTVFLDRAIPDAKAYYDFLGLTYDDLLLSHLKKYRYRNVFVLDILPLHNDYARTENKEEQLQIHSNLISVYEKMGYNIIHVPVLDPESRMEFILNHISEPVAT
ncbi:MAG: ATP-binding protein [Flavobacteriales bacterium]|nr:ATP-binding protein [Flavobacteriales bacterium]